MSDLLSMLGTHLAMRQVLKILAIGCKIVATIEWLAVAWFGICWDISELRGTSHSPYRDSGDMGTPAWHHRIYVEMVFTVIFLLLAAAPNRWFVSSRPKFWIILAIACLPALEVVVSSPAVMAAVALVSLFSFLPLSMIFSFWRQTTGQKITYA